MSFRFLAFIFVVFIYSILITELSQAQNESTHQKSKQEYALYAAFVAVCGVLIGYALSQYQFAKRTEHEKGLKLKESQPAFQRDIYISAAERIAEHTIAILEMPSKDIADIQRDFKNINLVATVNKVNMIGSNSTIDALTSHSKKSSKMILNGYFSLLRRKVYSDKAEELSKR